MAGPGRYCWPRHPMPSFIFSTAFIEPQGTRMVSIEPPPPIERERERRFRVYEEAPGFRPGPVPPPPPILYSRNGGSKCVS
jgi:hypothetical protein